MDAKIFAVDQIGLLLTRSLPPQMIVTAHGRVPSMGWSSGRLIPHVYVQQPADGIWDFDFVATMPQGISAQVVSPIIAAPFTATKPTWCKGVRVWASSNSDVGSFFVELASKDPSLSEQTELPGDEFPCFEGHGVAVQSLRSLIKDHPGPGSLDDPIKSIIGRVVRVIREGDPITMDYLPQRLNIVLADVRRISSIWFG